VARSSHLLVLALSTASKYPGCVLLHPAALWTLMQPRFIVVVVVVDVVVVVVVTFVVCHTFQ